METVLRNIRDLLDKDSHVESETARARFISIGSVSQDVEVFAYVFAPSYEEFLAIQEQLLLRILEIAELAGTALAVPLQHTYIVRDAVPSGLGQKAKASAASGH